jgi:hypothetical protein
MQHFDTTPNGPSVLLVDLTRNGSFFATTSCKRPACRKRYRAATYVADMLKCFKNNTLYTSRRCISSKNVLHEVRTGRPIPRRVRDEWTRSERKLQNFRWFVVNTKWGHEWVNHPIRTLYKVVIKAAISCLFVPKQICINQPRALAS